jgi:hypothetical protein
VVKNAPAQKGVGQVLFRVARHDDYDPRFIFCPLYRLVDFMNVKLVIFHFIEQVIGKVPGRLVYFIYQHHAAARFIFQAVEFPDAGKPLQVFAFFAMGQSDRFSQGP